MKNIPCSNFVNRFSFLESQSTDVNAGKLNVMTVYRFDIKPLSPGQSRF